MSDSLDDDIAWDTAFLAEFRRSSELLEAALDGSSEAAAAFRLRADLSRLEWMSPEEIAREGQEP